MLGGRDDLVTVAEGISPQRLDALFASFDVHPAGPRTASVEGMVRQLVEAASAHPDGMASVVMPPEAPGAIKLLVQLTDVAETAYVLADAVKPGSTHDKFLAATQDALEGARELIGRGGSDEPTYRRVLSVMNGFPVPRPATSARTRHMANRPLSWRNSIAPSPRRRVAGWCRSSWRR